MPGCGLVLAWSHSSRHLEHQHVCSGQHTIGTKETKRVILCRGKKLTITAETLCKQKHLIFDHHYFFSVNNLKRPDDINMKYKVQSLECLCQF